LALHISLSSHFDSALCALPLPEHSGAVTDRGDGQFDVDATATALPSRMLKMPSPTRSLRRMGSATSMLAIRGARLLMEGGGQQAPPGPPLPGRDVKRCFSLDETGRPDNPLVTDDHLEQADVGSGFQTLGDWGCHDCDDDARSRVEIHAILRMPATAHPIRNASEVLVVSGTAVPSPTKGDTMTVKTTCETTRWLSNDMLAATGQDVPSQPSRRKDLGTDTFLRQ
jgi:hypothetical protein